MAKEEAPIYVVISDQAPARTRANGPIGLWKRVFYILICWRADGFQYKASTSTIWAARGTDNSSGSTPLPSVLDAFPPSASLPP
ncbi:unnamed protein product [Arabis nemorensis]|uniref:Uncharacterized protein n=1 Tax=Arabis nemorensis TaxID=586526 RepID=A0A565CFI2_9BRAS|nr:unnamed protein product [Arabis nemorensis]